MQVLFLTLLKTIHGMQAIPVFLNRRAEKNNQVII